MSFSFGGGPTPAAAPFGFGSPAPNSTIPTTTPPAAPLAFGAPSPFAVGGGGAATTATAAAFGAPAAAPFGTTPFASASSGSSLFGSPPPVAPAAFGGTNLFGAPPATTTSSLFGGGGGMASATAAPFSFSTSSSLLQQQQQQQPSISLYGGLTVRNPPTIAGHMYYDQLPPDMKRAMDMVHEAIQRHKQTIYHLSTMGPKVLQAPNTTSTTTTTFNTNTQQCLLQEQIHQLQNQLIRLQHETGQLLAPVQTEHAASEAAVVHATLYAKWPVEAMAVRKGVRLLTTPTPFDAHAGSVAEEKESDDGAAAAMANNNDRMQQQIQNALNRGMAAVDRIDRMPSPYYWETLQSLETRAMTLLQQTSVLESQLDSQQQWKNQQQQSLVSSGGAVVVHTDSSSTESVAERIQNVVETQHVAIARLSQQIQGLVDEMVRVRLRYRQCEQRRGGENVLDQAAVAAHDRHRKIQEQVLMRFLEAAAVDVPPAVAAPSLPAALGSAPPPSSQLFLGAPAAPTLFGAAPTAFGPAPTALGAAPIAFGAAPAPASTFAFAAPSGSAPLAPTAATTTNALGSSTLASSSGTGTSLFGGSNVAPQAAATTSFFGAPAPAAGFNGFASTSTTPSNKKKSSSRSGGNSSRLRR